MSFQFNFFGGENTESEEVERVRENVPELVRHEILPKRDDALGQVKEIEGVKYRIGKNGEFLSFFAYWGKICQIDLHQVLPKGLVSRI